MGTVCVEVPWDRAGSFEPGIVPKHKSWLPGFNEPIISLYARGMTVRGASRRICRTCTGVEVCPELISRVTAAVLDELKQWQSRPLDRVYAAIYLDAIVCKVCHEGIVQNKAAYLAVGISAEGVKDVLGIWIDTSEGAKCVWPNEFASFAEALAAISAWALDYNTERPHNSLGQRTPTEAREEALCSLNSAA